MAGFPGQAVPATEVDRAQCAVFAGWEVGGVFIERNRKLGSLCFALSERNQQMASVQGRQRAAMEAGWQGAVLFIRRGENDGRAGETGNQLRSRSARGVVSDPPATTNFCAGRVFL